MDITALIFNVIVGIICPVLWLVLGIIFCIKGIDTKKSLALMLSAFRVLAIRVFSSILIPLIVFGRVPGSYLYTAPYINIACCIAMGVIALSYKGSLAGRIVSVGLFFFGCLLFVLNFLILEYLLGMGAYLGDLFYTSGVLVFIFGTGKKQEHGAV